METTRGLTQLEAETRLKQYGPNEIKEVNKNSPLQLLLRQVKKNFVVYLLVIVSIISFLIGKNITGYVIISVILLVVGLGFIQEFKAEKAIGALKKMIMPISILFRDGQEKEVPSEQIVPGDVIVLRNGEKIPADCVVIDESALRVNESILTGEAQEVKKIVPQGQEYNDDNLLFMGTYIVNGRCYAQALHTGMNTRFGKIAGMISTAEKELPLQIKVNKISRYMVFVALGVSTLTGLIMFSRVDTLSTEVVVNILILVIAVAVSAFPESFPLVLVTALATGASRMAKHNAIVNRMSIIETLGETTVICTDKTGTITKGQMTVNKLYADNMMFEVTGSGYVGHGEFTYQDQGIMIRDNPVCQQLFRTALLCNDTKIARTGNDMEFKVSGSPTEAALLILGAKAALYKEDLIVTRVEEMPFDSQRKMMSVLGKEHDSQYVFVKGAPEIVLAKCSQIATGNGEYQLSDGDRERVIAVNKDLNSQALRTIALAYKHAAADTTEYDEDNLIFLGIVGMMDPPHDEVAGAIAMAKTAGIQVKMITGDNRDTAVSIGQQIGLVGDILEGKDMDALSDAELAPVVNNTAIFARVRPEHKLRIVRALKQNGEVVTMTGDGVNDAPALREAHIGVAMGLNGTDVSRSVADLTLKDDNFVTIIHAIQEGRTIFNNIRKFVTYQLSCNVAELSIIFFGVLLAPWLDWPIPLLLALQILFMNMVTSDLPAITLGVNPSSKDIMNEKPRRNAQILTKELIALLVFTGSLMATITLGVFYLMHNVYGVETETSRTVALIILIMLEIACAFNFRSFRHKVINRYIFANKYLVYASIVSIAATLAIIYTALHTVFETVAVDGMGWMVALLCSFTIVFIFDTLKDISVKKRILLAEIT